MRIFRTSPQNVVHPQNMQGHGSGNFVNFEMRKHWIAGDSGGGIGRHSGGAAADWEVSGGPHHHDCWRWRCRHRAGRATGRGHRAPEHAVCTLPTCCPVLLQESLLCQQLGTLNGQGRRANWRMVSCTPPVQSSKENEEQIGMVFGGAARASDHLSGVENIPFVPCIYSICTSLSAPWSDWCCVAILCHNEAKMAS